MKTGPFSNLQKKLSRGKFVVTAECGPPRGANQDVIAKKIGLLKDYVDAVNVTDNQTAIVRMSSIAASAQLVNAGLEPVMQMVVRDRNRIAIQSDIMGAYALGIKNILCLSGDHQQFGSQPDALNVFDIDSINLIRAVKDMRDRGKDMNGHDLDIAPEMFIGAAANPFADPFEYRILRLAKKIDAGADFIQTQCIYNIDKFKEWMKKAADLGLTKKTYILGGLTPLRSASMARYMNNEVAGMDIPDEIIKRMDSAAKDKQAEEGLKICIETIKQIREIDGISGVHIMAIEWEEVVARIVKEAGLKE
jgi:methylenetetrahydrofolate reductase (NADPH)